MLGWIPVLIIGGFLLGCGVFIVASFYQIFRNVNRKKNKMKPASVVSKKPELLLIK